MRGALDAAADLLGRAPMPPRWSLGYLQSTRHFDERGRIAAPAGDVPGKASSVRCAHPALELRRGDGLEPGRRVARLASRARAGSRRADRRLARAGLPRDHARIPGAASGVAALCRGGSEGIPAGRRLSRHAGRSANAGHVHDAGNGSSTSRIRRRASGGGRSIATSSARVSTAGGSTAARARRRNPGCTKAPARCCTTVTI